VGNEAAHYSAFNPLYIKECAATLAIGKAAFALAAALIAVSFGSGAEPDAQSEAVAK
jgi:hypothetical protein